jgi:hypothetical protein
MENIESTYCDNPQEISKEKIEELIKGCQEKHEAYAKLADKLIEQHPLFARIVADRFDKYGWMPIKQQPIVPKEASYGNGVVWTNSPLVIPTGVSIMCGI